MAEGSDLPSHVLVQKQLQDVILAQQAAVHRLHEATSVREDVVSREQYDAVLRELEDEKIAHAATVAKLNDTADRLEFALGEIEVLQKQIEREKLQFEKSFGLLKNKAVKETSKKIELENKCSVIEKQVVEQEDVLETKEQQLQELNKKLKEQKDIHDRQLLEINVKQQQDLYIAKMFQDDDRKRTKRKGSNKKI